MKMFGSLRAFHISCEEKAEIPEGVCGVWNSVGKQA